MSERDAKRDQLKQHSSAGKKILIPVLVLMALLIAVGGWFALGSVTSRGPQLVSPDPNGAIRLAAADFRREYLGFIFQSHNLISYLNALENVMLPLAVTTLSAAEKRQRASRMLERVGLPDRMLHLPQQLSGGEQERVAIASALVNNPPLLLADEPTGSLDTATSLQIMTLLRDLHRDGQTIIMVTHNRENLQWFDRTVALRDGRLEQDTGESAGALSERCEVTCS